MSKVQEIGIIVLVPTLNLNICRHCIYHGLKVEIVQLDKIGTEIFMVLCSVIWNQ